MNVSETMGYLEHLLRQFCETVSIIDMEKIEKEINESEEEMIDDSEEDDENAEYWKKAPNFELMVKVLNELIFFIEQV